MPILVFNPKVSSFVSLQKVALLKSFFYHITLLSLLSQLACTRQPGCIDPNAANYVYEAKKDDGSCLYDMSFWINSSQHGAVYISVDGVLRDSLFCFWQGRIPRCGVDTFIYVNGFSLGCTANIALKAGRHDVKVEAEDGTIWENSYVLPENCLSVLIDAVD